MLNSSLTFSLYSGKSTLLSVLLRLVEFPRVEACTLPYKESDILVDNLSIAAVPRTHLRSRILSIPQQALTLSGMTFRFNLNPVLTTIYKEADHESEDETLYDDLIISSLTKVGLWDIVEARGGLGAKMTLDCLSKGQLQLFAIARTVVRKTVAETKISSQGPPPFRILLLDEATSHLDSEMDARVRKLIWQEFRDFTIVIIAHRSGLIQDCDMVGVMEGGRMIQYGPPASVLA